MVKRANAGADEKHNITKQSGTSKQINVIT